MGSELREYAEILHHLGARGGDVDIADQYDHRIVGCVLGAEPLLHVINRSRVEVSHRTDRALLIGVAGGKQPLVQQPDGA